MDQLLTFDDLAERFPVPEATWRYWRHKGIGPKGAKIGRRIFYRESEVQAWFDRQFDAAEQPGDGAA